MALTGEVAVVAIEEQKIKGLISIRGAAMAGLRKGTREKAFSRRLDKALTAHPRSPAGYGRNTWLIRELAHQNVVVSNETIRKWLTGEAMPRRDKMAALAKTLRVDETWLAMGAQPASDTISGAVIDKASTLAEALKAIRDKTDDPEILAIIERGLGDD